MNEAMERDENSRRDSWQKEKTAEFEAKVDFLLIDRVLTSAFTQIQNLQMQLSQSKLLVERLTENEVGVLFGISCAN